jgi:signal transduction histidine kinase
LIIKNRATLGSLSASDIDSARGEFDQIAASAARSLDEVRQIAYDLRPYHLDRLGLTSSIEEMIERVAASSDIRFSSTIAPLDGVMPKDMEINLYRIVQEGVNNIVRHSRASHAWIEIARQARELTISIRDDGHGFTAASAAEPHRRFGLTGIAERVQMLGGSHTVVSSAAQGTIITITLPLQDPGRQQRDAASDHSRSRG